MGRKRKQDAGRAGQQAHAGPEEHTPEPPPPAAETRFAWPFGLDYLLIVLPGILACYHVLGSRDLPMHMAIGEWILDHGVFPTPDPFSFTAQGTEWVPHEWLAGVFFAAVERFGGETLLSVVLFASGALLAWCIRALTRALKLDTSTYLLWSIPLWLMLGRRMILRPHLFASMLPFLLWWVLLRARERPKWLWAVPAVMVVWVNLHGSFLLGFGIIGLDLIACGPWHPLPWKQRGIAFALSVAAILTQIHIHVSGDLLGGIQHAFSLVGDPVFMEHILEWRPPFAGENNTFQVTYAYWLAIAWIGLAAWGFVRHGSRLPLSFRLFVLVTLLLFLRHQRFLMLFAPASLAVMPRPHWTAARAHAARVGVVLLSVLFLSVGYPVAPGTIRPPGSGWDTNLPLGDILERGLKEFPNSLLPEKKGIFCEYTFGGILMWKGKGELQPTMDGRNTVYGSELYLKHRAALAGPCTYREELLEQVGAVLINHPSYKPAREELVQRLLSDTRWKWEIATPRSNEPYLLFLKHEPARGPNNR